MIAVFVALAGGVGAALRFVVDGVVARHWRGPVPLGTLVINVTGSFLLGLLFGLLSDHRVFSEVYAVVGTGMLGGYTTFSTASVEAVTIARQEGGRAVLVAAGHATVMLLLGMAAAGLGWWLG